MNRKQDIADKLRTHVDRLNFFIAVAHNEGLECKLSPNLSRIHNADGLHEFFQIEVTESNTPKHD